MTAADRTDAPAHAGRAARWTGLAMVVVAWELAARGLAGSYVLAGPVDVALHASQNAGLLLRALAVTLQNAAAGFVLGNLVAVMLALTAILVPRLERLIAALALVVFCLPLVATGPILRVLFGAGPGPQITLAALAVYYSTFVPLLVGLRAAPQSWFDLVRSYGRGRLSELVHLRVMAARPYFLAGLQIAAPSAFLGAMVGEFTGAERGMGVLAIRAMRALDVEATWTLAAIASGVAMLVYAGIGAAGRRMTTARPEMLLAAPPTVRSAGAGALARRVGVALLTAAVLFGAWKGLMEAFGLNPFFAKRPEDVLHFLATATEAAANRATLLIALGETLAYTIPGYMAGLGLGVAIAALLVLRPGLALTILPVAIALRSVPIVTTAPLIVLALGRGAAGTVTIVAVMIFFPTLVACLHGLRQTPGQVLDLFESYDAGRWRRLIFASFPAMLPAFFASARMSVPAAFLAVTVAEWLATGSGLGNLMALTASTSDYNMLWSATAVLALVAVLAHAALTALERSVLARYAPEQLG